MFYLQIIIYQKVVGFFGGGVYFYNVSALSSALVVDASFVSNLLPRASESVCVTEVLGSGARRIHPYGALSDGIRIKSGFPAHCMRGSGKDAEE